MDYIKEINKIKGYSFQVLHKKRSKGRLFLLFYDNLYEDHYDEIPWANTWYNNPNRFMKKTLERLQKQELKKKKYNENIFNIYPGDRIKFKLNILGFTFKLTREVLYVSSLRGYRIELLLGIKENIHNKDIIKISKTKRKQTNEES